MDPLDTARSETAEGAGGVALADLAETTGVAGEDCVLVDWGGDKDCGLFDWGGESQGGDDGKKEGGELHFLLVDCWLGGCLTGMESFGQWWETRWFLKSSDHVSAAVGGVLPPPLDRHEYRSTFCGYIHLTTLR